MGAIIEERHYLTPDSQGITEADGKGASWNGDIWDLTVPIGQGFSLSAEDILALYLIGDDAAEMPAKTQIRLAKRDAAGQSTTPIFNAIYQQFKELTDKNKVQKLTGVQGVVEFSAGEHLVLMVNGVDVATTGDTDVSASHFRLSMMRKRKQLG